MKAKIVILVYMLAIGMLMVSSSACDSRDDYIGRYIAIDKGASTEKQNIIELMKSGQGVWKCCEEKDEVAFTWYIKGKELRIYTKGGGVMTGKLRKNSFVMTLPEEKGLVFNKIISEN